MQSFDKQKSLVYLPLVSGLINEMINMHSSTSHSWMIYIN